ncbi:MAG: 3-dehydroquinate synthase, partial [Parasutterella excrementihominis]
ERDMEKLRALDPETVAEVVGRSCEIKAGVVSRDEKEKGERAKLNLGHTFGHAIEKLTGYGTWLHGEAVAVGTVLAVVTAEKQGKINCGDVKRIQDLIHRAGLPVRIAGISASKAIEAMKGDKKSTKGVPHFILPVAIGTTVIEEVPEGLIKEALLEEGYEP